MRYLPASAVLAIIAISPVSQDHAIGQSKMYAPGTGVRLYSENE